MAKRRARKGAPRARKSVRKTARKTVRKTVRKTNARAIEAALAATAHDIRTPLTGILALAELLVSSDVGAREREWALAIKSGAEHLAALTALIIDAAKAEVTGLALRREPFSPRRLAETVAAALTARTQARGLAAEIAIAADLPALVAGDEMRLRAALENLADNAIKFTGGGSVAFSVSAARAPKKRMQLNFAFSDTGIGISKEEIARLFRPFAQASERVARRYGGAGLGLVFVKRLAKAMGGDLTIDSRPGRGSVFRLSVIVEPLDSRSAPRGDSVRVRRQRPLQILCAEDNAYGRVVMNTILVELGHRVDFVESGDAAVRSVAAGNYDAVLMDIALPILNGIEAAAQIRALAGPAARLPIIGISGRTEAGDAAAARAAGMNFYFTKPVSPAKLAHALSDLSSARPRASEDTDLDRSPPSQE